MRNYSPTLIKKYFEEQSFVDSNIRSFNVFIEKMLQQIVDENKDIIPTIIPENVDEFKIEFGRVEVGMPEIIEADGSKRDIYPVEARLRKLSYAAPLRITVSARVNGVKRESFVTQIGSLPIMLKSKFCHLSKLNKEELVEKGEDPNDTGGYFIINGTERVIISIEDLASNRFITTEEGTGVSEFVGKLFSEKGSFKIPHSLEKMKDGMFYLSFTRVKRMPLVVILKALGLKKDEDIMNAVSTKEKYDDVMINLFEHLSVKTEEEALDYIAKRIGITQAHEVRVERTKEILDKYLLPHLGTDPKDRLSKAVNLCKMLRKYIQVSSNVREEDDKDHYMNKRVKLSGDLLADLVLVNLKVLIGDLLYNYQRIVKRGKYPSLKVIIRDKLLTQRFYSSMATGNWVGGRKGVSQRIQRLNFLETLSHLQRVISPLSSSQENFDARELHPTHLGRLCPIETPEGTNIGLRKNFALLTGVSEECDEERVVKHISSLGMKPALR